MPQDTSTPAPQPSLGSARQAHPPLRARLSLLRQQIILTFRWYLRPFYRIPIDDLKEDRIQSAIKRLAENQSTLLRYLNELIGVQNQLQRRVLFYEKHIPRMRDLKREFDREEALLAKAAQAPQREATEKFEHGILTVPATNGHGPAIEIVRP